MTEIVSFKKADGKRIQARLVKENTHTAIVKPYIWLKSKAIKIHIKKNKMLLTGRII